MFSEPKRAERKEARPRALLQQCYPGTRSKGPPVPSSGAPLPQQGGLGQGLSGSPQGPVKLSEMLAGGGRATKGKRSEDRCFWSNFKPLDAHQPRPPRQRWLSGSLLSQLLLPPREPMALPTPLGFSSVPGQGLLPQGDFLQLSCSTQLTKGAVPESGD